MEEIIIGLFIIGTFIYFSIKYGWFKKRQCAYCSNKARKDSNFCSDECRKQYFGE